MSRSSAAAVFAIRSGWSAAADHPFAPIVRAWLRDEGDDPASFECSEEDGALLWHIAVDPGISLIVKLYEDQTGRVFFILEAALADFGAVPREAALAAVLKLNRGLFEVFRAGLMEDGVVTCLARGRCEGINPEYFRFLLENILPLSREMQKDLVEVHQLEPYRKTEKQKA